MRKIQGERTKEGQDEDNADGVQSPSNDEPKLAGRQLWTYVTDAGQSCPYLSPGMADEGERGGFQR